MKDLTERTLIDKIREKAGGGKKDLILGIGDDCAIFGHQYKGPWLISTDMLVDATHFDRNWHTPHLLGRKCIAVNLSDIAAMGGIPRFLLISISLPEYISSQWVTEWFRGVLEISEQYNCHIIGGDTVSGTELTISVTVLGSQLPEGPIVRSGANVGDRIYVSGNLGSAAIGLELFLKQKRKEIKELNPLWQEALTAHLNPVPQIELGKNLCKSGCVSAMLDISDGLATDLSHICRESKVGALVEQRKLPSAKVLDDICSELSLSKLDALLRGGEDYQLVFTVKKESLQMFETIIENKNLHVTAIGEIDNGHGVILQSLDGTTQDISYQGYEHRRQ